MTEKLTPYLEALVPVFYSLPVKKVCRLSLKEQWTKKKQLAKFYQSCKTLEANNDENKVATTLNDIRKQIWALTGELDYDLGEKDLLKVLGRHSSIGFVPQGYFYPELLTQAKMPNELEEALKNKERHNRMQNHTTN